MTDSVSFFMRYSFGLTLTSQTLPPSLVGLIIGRFVVGRGGRIVIVERRMPGTA